MMASYWMDNGGRKTRPWLLLLLVTVSCSLATAVESSRLVEKEIRFPVHRPVSDTPLIDPPRRIAGYFKLNRTHDAKMFYFFFESRSSPEKDAVVLWMTGGPGCSSEIAIFFENGPYSINNDTATLSETKYGWDTHHNMIFVDQPIGTGFSYSEDWRDRVYNERVVGDDMLDFMYAFYEAHPEFLKNDFFVTGESYAGHYVPAVSSAIYRANELGQGPITVPLRGLAIGNGLTAPVVQFPAYADFALENGLISKGLHDSIQWWMPLCTWGADFCDSHSWRLPCVMALQVCQLVSFQRILAANPNINVYDITKTCDGPLCYDMSAADDFLNRPEVREQLGVGNRRWSECDMGVNGDFMGDFLRSYDKLLPPMLEDGIRIMIYTGDRDLICNWVGNQRWVDALEWERSEKWPAVGPVEWAAGGKAAGTVRELGTLSFVRVYEAGHMVPMDQPRNALSMLWRFTRNHSLTAPPEAIGEPELMRVAEPVAAITQQTTAAGSGGSAASKSAAAAARQQRTRQETYRRDKPLDATQVDLGVLGRHAGREGGVLTRAGQVAGEEQGVMVA